MTWRKELVNLFLPVACAGCGAWDWNICPECERLLDVEPGLSALESSPGEPDIPIYSLARYGGSVRRIIIAAKHQPGRNLDAFLYQAGAVLSQQASVILIGANEVWVVPAPSSFRRRWDRREVTGSIADGVRDGLAALLPEADVRVRAAARLKSGHGSQSAKSGAARRAGRKDSFVLIAKPPPGTAVVLVDDVLTTGATMDALASVFGLHAQVGLVLARA